MAEWLRRQIRNLMGSSRAGSNPAGVALGKQLDNNRPLSSVVEHGIADPTVAGSIPVAPLTLSSLV